MAETTVRIRPTQSFDYLGNPHKGLCTFQHFNGEALFPGNYWSEAGPLEDQAEDAAHLEELQKIRNHKIHQFYYPHWAKGYMATTVSYCRWFWCEMETVQGDYDFSMIDRALKLCVDRQQTLAVRLMAYGSSKQPQVPTWYSDQFPMEKNQKKTLGLDVPVHDSPEYLEHWGNLVKEFAQRYDDNPLIESIDITFIGPWGEGAGDCSAEQIEKFNVLWEEAFSNVPRLALIEGRQLPVGVRHGSGWRCDCFGDARNPGSSEVIRSASFNHMYDCYPEEIVNGGAQDAWKTAPVHMESCGVPIDWYNAGGDIDFIIQQGLKFHATYLMPKYTALPEAWMDKLREFCKQLGYRFVFRQAMFDMNLQSGGQWHFKAWVENIGVAPIYRRYDFAIRIRQGDNEQIIRVQDEDIRQWLPGDAIIERDFAIDASFIPGMAEISAGLLNEAGEVKVRFANTDQFQDFWLRLGFAQITQ
ncbi:MAG: DUF4832 domain-containing protein [Planctomycetes bacterium]|nr:DUF4832 domain-containing protein [Planctomycetota bacterium]